MQSNANLKVAAFREFASQLAVQIVEQLCTEYEREVNVMYSELVTYRTELERVAELLGHQLGRERQLHDMLTTMGDVHSSMVAQMEGIAQQRPDHKILHDMVDAMQGQQVNVINSTLTGMSEAQTVASAHAMTASTMKEQTITAEHEFNRIVQLLQTPLIPGQMPAPTMVQVPTIGSPRAMGHRQTPPASPIITRAPLKHVTKMTSPVAGSPINGVPGTLAQPMWQPVYA